VLGEVLGWKDAQTIQIDCTHACDPSEAVLFPVLASQSRGSRICGSPALSAATGRAPPSSAPIRR
jgi:hypothetical protein